MELDFITETISVIWRALFILWGATLAGKILFGLISSRTFIGRLPPERRLAWWGVEIFIAQSLVIQIARFNDPVLLRGLPVSTLAFTIFWIALRHIRDPDKRDMRESEARTTANTLPPPARPSH